MKEKLNQLIGKRVRITQLCNKEKFYTAGDRGTVKAIDGANQIEVSWDEKGTISLLLEDSFEVLSKYTFATSTDGIYAVEAGSKEEAKALLNIQGIKGSKLFHLEDASLLNFSTLSNVYCDDCGKELKTNTLFTKCRCGMWVLNRNYFNPAYDHEIYEEILKELNK